MCFPFLCAFLLLFPVLFWRLCSQVILYFYLFYYFLTHGWLVHWFLLSLLTVFSLPQSSSGYHVSSLPSLSSCFVFFLLTIFMFLFLRILKFLFSHCSTSVSFPFICPVVHCAIATVCSIPSTWSKIHNYHSSSTLNCMLLCIWRSQTTVTTATTLTTQLQAPWKRKGNRVTHVVPPLSILYWT